MSETAKVVPESGKQNIHFRVVITGGPCSGKTTLVPLLVKRFNQESSGWMANSSPEAATTFGLNTPQGYISWGSALVRRFIFEHNALWEKSRAEMAAAVDINTITFSDRAFLDNAAYGSSGFENMLIEKKTSWVELLYHHDIAFHLVSLAVDTIGQYDKHFNNNDVRYENEELAKEVDKRTLDVYCSHPNVMVIPNVGNLELKLDFICECIESHLGRIKGSDRVHTRDLVWHVDTIPEPFPGLYYDFTVESVRVTSTKKLQRVVHKGHEAYILNETIRVRYNGEWIHMPKCTAVPRDEFISSISLPDATVTKEDCRRFTILYFPAELSMIANEDSTYTLRMRGVPQRQHRESLFVDLEVGISKIFGKKFSSHNEEKAVATNSEA